MTRPHPARRSPTLRRLAASTAALTLLLVPATPATATEDDPAPTRWPRIQPPASNGNAADPTPTRWPRIQPPSAAGTEDPIPPKWPKPRQP
ncbi:hypothetical protein GCM10009534_07060 [Kribbella sandramycini]|uniref:Uncharacterized protein n=1 Tax=Kribbella sandramycini TaxID=60450 RepID=A0A841S7K9_9ACTN|nr:hypothetical protein [Kribbella sandramycini]